MCDVMEIKDFFCAGEMHPTIFFRYMETCFSCYNICVSFNPNSKISTMVQLLGLLPLSKVPDSNPSCVEFACFLRVCVGFVWALWFPPTVYKHAL